MKVSRLTLGLALAALIAAADAQTFSYAGKAQRIRAGVLIIESQRRGALGGVRANPAPHVWSNLDLDAAIKPASWRFDNPRASSVLSEAIRSRWGVLDPSGTPGVGTRLTKRMAPYWEVSLSAEGDRALASYDVLLLPLESRLALNAPEREKMRRFVDQGGVLWVDVLNSNQLSIDVANPLPFPFTLQTSPAGPLFTASQHPLLNWPNPVSLMDLYLVQGFGGIVVQDVTPGDLGSLQRILSWIPADSVRLRRVVVDATGATVLVGQIGDGHVVVTSRGVSTYLNRGVDRSTNPPRIVVNDGFFAYEPVFDGAYAAAAKLAINLISQPNTFATPGGGTRQSSRRSVEVDAPLLRRFSAPVAGLNPFKPPVIYKGRAIFSTNDRVVVLDADPGRDLDRDGNPDDGEIDQLDSQVDVLWQSQPMAAPISAPVAVEVPNSSIPNGFGGTVVNQILVTDAQGRVFIYDVDTPRGSAVAPAAGPIAPPSSGVMTGVPHPPTVHEGLGYAVDGKQQLGQILGRVWMFDASTGQRLNSGVGEDWKIEDTPRMREPSFSPSVGYIPILDNSGGLDKVVYVPYLPGGANRPAGLTSIWIGVRGENPLNIVNTGGGTLQVTTRATLQGLSIYEAPASSSIGIKVTLLNPSGVPYPISSLQQIFTGAVSQSSPGILNFSLGPLGNTLNWDEVQFRIDYTIDWGKAGTGGGSIPSDAFVRGNLEFPDDAATERRVRGAAAMAPNGNVFIVTGPPSGGTGGTLFALREEGRGEFKLVYRWDLYDALTMRLNNAGGGSNELVLRAALTDQDWLVTNFIQFLNRPMSRLTFTSGPAVSNDTVYVVATAQKPVLNGAAPVGIMLAFNADPQPAEFEISNVQSGFALLQPDVARSQTKNQPEVFSVLQSGQFSYEEEPLSNRARVRLNNMMSISRGRIRDSITTSLPLMIRRGGNTDIVIEPESQFDGGGVVPGYSRGRWNPLKWYWVFNGFEPGGQPIVTGDCLYVAGGSALPSLIQGQFPPSLTGMIFAIDARMSPNDPFLRQNTYRDWHYQVNSLLPQGGPPPFRVNPAQRWPQTYGIQSFDDLRVRMLQNTLSTPTTYGIVAGEGLLMAWDSQRIYGFRKADFLVADEGRVGRYDSNGNVIWSTDKTVQAGTSTPTGHTTTGRGISRPTRVYPQGDSTYWVVDTGNSRIVRLDGAGRELRSLEGMKLDPSFDPRRARLPLEVPDNPRLSFANPRDVLVYESIETPATNPFSNAQPSEYWVHYIVADTGNYRLLELVDRYVYNAQQGVVEGVVEYIDPTSTKPNQRERALGMLLWHSPATLSNRPYAYNSVDRLVVPGLTGPSVFLAFGFSNAEPGRTTFGMDSQAQQDFDRASGYGGIVILDMTARRTEVINEVRVPATAANVFYNEQTQQFDSPARPITTRKIENLTSTTLRYVTSPLGPRIAVMYTDRFGVTEVVKLGAAQDQWDVRWMLLEEAYRVMRRRSSDNQPTGVNADALRATYARRLDSGDVLLASGYVGRTRNGTPFYGEVALVEGTIGGNDNTMPWFAWNRTNLGFNSLSVKYELPPVVGGRGLVVPVFADRR